MDTLTLNEGLKGVRCTHETENLRLKSKNIRKNSEIKVLLMHRI